MRKILSLLKEISIMMKINLKIKHCLKQVLMNLKMGLFYSLYEWFHPDYREQCI